MMQPPKCPICGAQMKRWGRGASEAKHGKRWVCPVAQAEVTADANGHLHRAPDAKHTTTNIWRTEEAQP